MADEPQRPLIEQKLIAQPSLEKPSLEKPSLDAPTPERLDPRLLELLVCPVTKTTLSYDAVNQELISKAARLAFPISKGVALLTIDAARELPE